MTTQVTIPEASVALGISIKTVRRWIDKNKLKATKVNGKWLVDISDQVEMPAVIPSDQSASISGGKQ